MIYLLDSNVVIALADHAHLHRSRCDSWFKTINHFALCPISEGALVRFIMRTGKSPAVAVAVLRKNAALDGYEFWPDAVSYMDADLSRIMGHQQVTDAYLIALVRNHPGSKLATLDEGLADLYPEDAYLIPG